MRWRFTREPEMIPVALCLSDEGVLQKMMRTIVDSIVSRRRTWNSLHDNLFMKLEKLEEGNYT